MAKIKEALLTDKQMKKSFQISSVCREDMTDHFLQTDIDLLTDEDMEWIARKMGDSFCDCCYWNALEVWTQAILDAKNK
jgi:hypothetical protein